jgi:hypothetical protein
VQYSVKNSQKEHDKMQQQQRPVERILAGIETLDLEPIKFKLMDSQEGEGWSREYADKVEVDYKRFLALVVKYPGQTIALSKETDKFWHGHILDTMKYAEDCQNVFGYFLHHFPYLGMRGSEDAAAQARAVEATASLYEQEFGVPSPIRAAMCGAAKPAMCGASVKAAMCGAAKPAMCGAAVSGKAAMCGAAVSGKAAMCGAAKPAMCGASVKAAMCGAAKPAMCGASVKAAMCGAAVEAAMCGAAKPAMCGAAVSDKVAMCGAAKPAMCGAAITKRSVAMCGAAKPAMCGAAVNDQAAMCGAAKPAMCGAAVMGSAFPNSVRPRLKLAA